MLALIALLLASPALDQARAALDAGKLDGVLFALEKKDAVLKDKGKAAGALLVDAARLASARGDKPLALQLAQMALRRDEQSGAALKLLGEWSLKESEFNLAIKYGTRWTQAEPQSDEARRFLARAEDLERSWSPADTREKRRFHKKKEARAQEKAQVLVSESVPGAAPTRWGAPPVAAPAGRVVLYGTNWCGVCTRAREWLNAKGIAFEDKDIEADRSAAHELHEKERKAKMGHGGVPVIEVNGRLQPAGFSPAAIEWALKHGS